MKLKSVPFKSIAVLALFATGFAYSQDYKSIINSHLQKNASALNVSQSNLKDFEIENIDPSESLKGTLLTIQQSFMGKPIYNKIGKALIKEGQVSYFNSDFQKSTTTSLAQTAGFGVENAFDKAFEYLHLTGNKSDFVLSQLKEKTNIPLSQRLVKYQEMYFPINNELKLAYQLVFEDSKTSNSWNIVIDAQSGEMLLKENLLLICKFDDSPFSIGHNHQHPSTDLGLNTHTTESNNSGSNNRSSNLMVPNDASYNVLALPTESPIYGNRTLLTNPYVIGSSPQGWHNDMVAPPYTNTRGNNVYAYEDKANTNTPGLSPDGGANRTFNFPYSLSATATANLDASTTNLFYISNMMHDVLYKFGFKEQNRNFQNNNFGLGGNELDYVLSESQDGGGVNNANFNPGIDGIRGRMQMFLWTGNKQLLFFNAPTDMIPLNYTTGTAGFGPPLNAVGVTGNVGISTPTDGCTPITTNLTGKIGIVQRGNCTFVVKVKNAQNAGAIAVIVDNAIDSTNFANMAGTDATITIPSVSLQYENGLNIRNRIAQNTVVNVTLKDDPAINLQRDGSFDNGIVAHEYGHGLSMRLTGTGNGCLNTNIDNEQMGEGWSDFMTVMLTNSPGDNESVSRGIGNYAIFDPTTGGGIRPAKYSPDFAVNNFTYGATNTMFVVDATTGLSSVLVHDIGFVWNTMLWDLHWKYAQKYGYNSNVMANSTSGSARVFQLVFDGLKLQPCYPTFVEGRDALIAADQATTGGADRCMIWNVFARRGLGLLASAGSKIDITDQTEDFSVPTECITISTTDLDTVKNGIKLYPNPAKNDFSIRFPENQIVGVLSVSIFDASGKLVSEQKIKAEDNTKISTNGLPNGVYVVKAQGIGVNYTSQLLIKK